MNILEQKNIRSPSGDEEECAKFTVDDIEMPFIMHGITETDERYTLSFYVKSSISASITIAGTAYPTLSEWVRYVINFTADAADLPIYFDSPGTYYLYNTQLEVGDKDTDFSLSPDDYSTTAQMEAYIAVTSQNILSSVSRTYATKSEYGDLSDEFLSFQQTWKQEATELIGSDYIINTVGNYYALNDDLVSAESRITTAESVIAQHTSEIALTVKEQDVTGDYLIGKINLDSTTAQIEAKNINLTASDVVNIINSGTTTIEASKIDLSGYVTVSALGTAGATTIDGANITTGTISADRIDADGLFSKTVTATNLTVTGNSMLGGWNVTATRIKSSSSIYMGAAEAGFMIMNEANNCYLYAQNSSGTSTFQVTRDGYLVATGATINGSITATSLTAYDNIKILQSGGTTPSIALNAPASTGVSSLEIGNGFGQVTIKKSLYVSSGATIVGSTSLTGGAYNAGASQFHSNGFIELSGTTPFIDFHYDYSTADYTARIIADVAGGLSIYANGGNISIGKKVIVPPAGDAGIRGNGDNVYACGHPSYRWTAVHAKNGTIQTSDEREKDILEDFAPADLSAYFMSLEPIAYRWNYGNDQRIHFGLGAQTAKRKLELAGYSADAFSLIQHDYLEEPSANGLTDRYSMDYQGYNILTMAQCQINTRDLTALKEWQLTTDIELAVITQKQDTQEARIRDLEQQLTNALIEIEQLKAALAA